MDVAPTCKAGAGRGVWHAANCVQRGRTGAGLASLRERETGTASDGCVNVVVERG